MKYRFLGTVSLLLVLAAGGCESHIEPLRPVQRIQEWVPYESAPTPSTAPALASTEPATAPAPLAATTTPATLPALVSDPAAWASQVVGTAPATQPGHYVLKVIDPNQTSRFIYKASYDNIWQQAMTLFSNMGFALDHEDYRLGVLTTKPLPSAQFIEFWKPEHADTNNAMENTVNSQRRSLRLTISKVPDKPDFYEIGIQVLVEREANPSEEIHGPVFVEGSGFGRNALLLRSDYAEPRIQQRDWYVLGHDPHLEKKLLDLLFNRL